MSAESEVKVGVISAGALGSVFAKISAEQGLETTLYFHNPNSRIEFGRTRTSRRLPGIRLPEIIHPTSDMEAAVEGKDLVFVAVPSATIEEVFDRINPFIGDRTMLA